MLQKLIIILLLFPCATFAQNDSTAVDSLTTSTINLDSLPLITTGFTGFGILNPFGLGQPMEANDGGAYIPDPFGYNFTVFDGSLFIPPDSLDSLVAPAITFDFPMHGSYVDLTPGKEIDEGIVDIEDIKGGWTRIVSSGYNTPNGDAMYEPNEVHGSIYISDSKVYYLSYPERMHAFAEYSYENGEMNIFNQKVMPDSLDWFSSKPGLFTKDSLTYLFFDGEYYYRRDQDESLVLELEQKIIRPEVLIDDWVRQDSYWCCYGTENIMEYAWDMPENLHINKAWANKIYKRQKIYIEIDGQLRSFFISWLSGDLMILEPGSWFKGDSDNVRYIRHWD